MKKFLLILITLLPYFAIAQDDLLNMIDEAEKKDPHKDKSLNTVTGMFKDVKLINLQTQQTTGAGMLNFNISHRFGNAGKTSNGGVHTLYGWDAISDVRISLDYGITKKFQVGMGRNKRDEAIDGNIKWRFLEQTIDNKVPLSICLFSVASLTPKSTTALYNGADTAWISNEIAKKLTLSDRMTYTSQLVLARKFTNWLAVIVAPTYTHRNYVLAAINPSNKVADGTDILSVGAGMRLKITRSFSILADYFYVNSKYRVKNPTVPYYVPIAVGIELETGGHVFHLDFTNAAALSINSFIPNSPDTWGKGGYKLGFNISRAFPLGAAKKAEKAKKAAMANKQSETESQASSTTVHETKPAPAVSEPAPKVVEMPAKTAAPAKDMYKVTAVSINMRSGKDATSALIMKINKGASVEVVEKINTNLWKIKYNDETGYVSSKFLAK